MAGVPFGTKLVIGGLIYTVEDRGTPYGHVDIYMNSHTDATNFGVQYARCISGKSVVVQKAVKGKALAAFLRKETDDESRILGNDGAEAHRRTG